MLDNTTLWEKAVSEIEVSVSKANFSTWFKQTHISGQNDGIVMMSVPNAFVRDWLTNKYHKFILKALRDAAPYVRGVEYIIYREDTKQKQEPESPHGEPVTEQMRLGELYIGREDNLNPKYTFETFIVGTFNELAHAASQAVIKNFGVQYNPLFIYGGTGLGKTHLIQALGNHVKKSSDHKILYTSAEKYHTDYVDAMLHNKIPQFKEKYKKYDLLVIDDVQFMSGKDKTQEELFHLFNTLYEKNKQIVFSSDKPPKNIPGLEDRLRSRFEGGMIVDISKPDYESRLAILKTKARIKNFTPSEEIIEYIASVVQDNIRELEGVLNSVICHYQLKNKALVLQDIKNLIKENAKPQKTISIKDVIKTVADFYSIQEQNLYEKTRRKEVVKPRQVAMYILREYMNTSYPYIGQKLGGRDHTTVIHACEKIRNDCKLDSILTQEISQIRGILYGEPVGG